MKLLICLLLAPFFSFSQLKVEREVVPANIREIKAGDYSIQHFPAHKDSVLIFGFADAQYGRNGNIGTFNIKSTKDAIDLLSLINSENFKKDYNSKLTISNFENQQLKVEWIQKELSLFVIKNGRPTAIMRCLPNRMKDLFSQIIDPRPFK